MKNATKWSSSNISIENLRCRILDVREDAFECVGVVARAQLSGPINKIHNLRGELPADLLSLVLSVVL